MLNWDAEHYYDIKTSFYKKGIKDGPNAIFAFFPFFPTVWKTTNFSPLGISVLNFIFFCVSLLILTNLFSPYAKDDPHQQLVLFVVGLCIPLNVIFMIPYSEGVFMLCITLAIAGMLSGRYWTYFAFSILAAMTRPAAAVLLLTLAVTETLQLLKHKNGWLFVKELFLKSIPLIIGTGIVSYIQYQQGSGGYFVFIEAQKYWGHVLGFPSEIKDWSHEQFCTNSAIMLIIIPLTLYYLGKRVLNNFKISDKSYVSTFRSTYANGMEYLLDLSLVYVLGMFLFVILFREGSLHCLSRFVICTPFFYIILYHLFIKTKTIAASTLKKYFGVFFVLGFVLNTVYSYSKGFFFEDTGYLILTIIVLAAITYNRISWGKYRILLSVLFVISIIWTCYLFNIFLSNGWLFA